MNEMSAASAPKWLLGESEWKPAQSAGWASGGKEEEEEARAARNSSHPPAQPVLRRVTDRAQSSTGSSTRSSSSSSRSIPCKQPSVLNLYCATDPFSQC